MSNPCARVCKALAACERRAPKRGCMEAEAKALQCCGARLARAGECNEAHATWAACHAAVMSVGMYEGNKSCEAYAAQLRACAAERDDALTRRAPA